MSRFPRKILPDGISPTNQVYGRFCSINFRTLHLVISLRTVKFCRHFFHFSFFLLSNFLAKTTKNTVKHEKLPYVRKKFQKWTRFFFTESPKFALFWGGVALNFLELPLINKPYSVYWVIFRLLGAAALM